MFVLFERQKDFFEFEIPEKDNTKWALLVTSVVPLRLVRSGSYSSPSPWCS
jgi:hypothetical protein